MSAFEPGMLLVASPELVDPNFVDAVVLLLDVGEDGALGVVLTRPTPVGVDDVLPGWGGLAAAPEVLFQGGPVGTDGAIAVGLLRPGAAVPAGFSPLAGPPGQPGRPGRLGLVDLDADPADLAPALSDLRVFAGYAGWGPGQLDAELAEESWYVVPGEEGDVFLEQPGDLAREVLRRQPGDLALHSTRPLDPGLN